MYFGTGPVHVNFFGYVYYLPKSITTRTFLIICITFGDNRLFSYGCLFVLLVYASSSKQRCPDKYCLSILCKTHHLGSVPNIEKSLVVECQRYNRNIMFLNIKALPTKYSCKQYNNYCVYFIIIYRYAIFQQIYLYFR